MRISVGAGLIYCLCTAFLAAAMAPPSAGAAEARHFIPEFMGVTISPDGERVAAIRPHHNRNAIVVYRFDNPPGEGGEQTLVVPSGEEFDIIAMDWVGNRRLLIVGGFAHQNVDNYRQVDFTQYGTHMMSLDISNGRLTHYTDLNYASVVDPLHEDPDHIMIDEWASGFLRPALMNLNTGERDHLARGRRAWGSFALDNRNDPRALVTIEPSGGHIYWRETGGVSWHDIYQFEAIRGQSARPLGILQHDDQDYIYFISNHQGRDAVYRQMLTGGSPEVVYANDRFDVLTLEYNRRSSNRHYASYIGDVYQRHYFRTRTRQMDEALNEYIDGDFAYAMNASLDQSRFVVMAFSPGRPSEYYLYDANTGDLRFFAPQYLGLEEDELATVRNFDYRARDGLVIPGYLAVPPGMEEGPQPLLVWPHGGPFARDNMMFDPTRQFLASQGVLVFAPNFRGSTGYGNDFGGAGNGEWGRKMQTDVIDGVQALINQGFADPDRICIGGWSYGAYVALYAALETPEMFRCAFGVNGVYDLNAYSESLGQWNNFGYTDALRQDRWGDAANDRAALARMSPTDRAAEVAIPVMIIGSEEDPIADVSQSEDLIAALREAGKTPETLIFEEGDHSMGYGDSRIQTYEAMADFINRHLH